MIVLSLLLNVLCPLCGRLLRDSVQDPAFGRRYDQVLGALLCLCGAGLRTELDKQTRLVQLLGDLAEKVRQAGSSTRQVSIHRNGPTKCPTTTLFPIHVVTVYSLC